jgi:hypothetical protein
LDYGVGNNYWFRFPQSGDDSSIEVSGVSEMVDHQGQPSMTSLGGWEKNKINDGSLITDRLKSKGESKLKKVLSGSTGDIVSSEFSKPGPKSLQSPEQILLSGISNKGPLKGLRYLRKYANMPHKSSETPDQSPIGITNYKNPLKRAQSVESEPKFHKPANVIGINISVSPHKTIKESLFRNQNLYGHQYSSILENSQENANLVDLQQSDVYREGFELEVHEYIPRSNGILSHVTPSPWGKEGIKIESKSSKDSNFPFNEKDTKFLKKETNSDLGDMSIDRQSPPRVQTSDSKDIISGMLGFQRPPSIMFNAESKPG